MNNYVVPTGISVLFAAAVAAIIVTDRDEPLTWRDHVEAYGEDSISPVNDELIKLLYSENVWDNYDAAELIRDALTKGKHSQTYQTLIAGREQDIYQGLVDMIIRISPVESMDEIASSNDLIAVYGVYNLELLYNFLEANQEFLFSAWQLLEEARGKAIDEQKPLAEAELVLSMMQIMKFSPTKASSMLSVLSEYLDKESTLQNQIGVVYANIVLADPDLDHTVADILTEHLQDKDKPLSSRASAAKGLAIIASQDSCPEGLRKDIWALITDKTLELETSVLDAIGILGASNYEFATEAYSIIDTWLSFPHTAGEAMDGLIGLYSLVQAEYFLAKEVFTGDVVDQFTDPEVLERIEGTSFMKANLVSAALTLKLQAIAIHPEIAQEYGLETLEQIQGLKNVGVAIGYDGIDVTLGMLESSLRDFLMEMNTTPKSEQLPRGPVP